ncbi:hypothetical protein SCHPADRAFT_943856 [Schizopora paradoxa]|uniref:Uncharacterized protein n=1 Tax=Schizopora paradoxa TaxID=27342 RepID=A0A0H2RBH4_9AGAM|nr:hypothetical protein SCHPADRAFT_943856 [Schizopora paradoxa]
MSSLLNNIALIGKHSDDFTSELKKAGFTPVEFNSASELLADSDNLQVIALTGSDHGLTDKAAISKLLDGGKILIAFEPGIEYLTALHAATRTPVDLTAIKPTSERPLMVHKENGVDVLTLPPKVKTGFNVPDGKFRPVRKMAVRDEDTVYDIPDQGNGYEFSYRSAQIVERIRRAMDAVNGTSTETRAAAAGEVHGLEPGNDVAFYKKVQVRIPAEYSIKTLAFTWEGNINIPTNDVNEIQVYQTEWQMSIYVYATDANPIGQTADTYEGTIYTYIVHDGVHGRKLGSPGRNTNNNNNADLPEVIRNWEFYFIDILGYSLQDTSGFLTKVTQQPDDNIFEHRDNSFIYNISQEQRMILFKASQKQTWEFDANYQKPCAWNRFQMHRDMSNFDDARYVLSYNDLYDVWTDPEFEGKQWHNPGVFDDDENRIKTLPDDNIPISGLTVYSSKVGKAKLNLEFDYVPRGFDYQTLVIRRAIAAGVIGLYVDDFVLDLTWDE